MSAAPTAPRTAPLAATVLHPDDHVATALRPLHTGELVRIGTPHGIGELTVTDPIPLCHKLALTPLAAGTAVRKYGAVIGTTSEAIPAGGHVHVHNLVSNRARKTSESPLHG